MSECKTCRGTGREIKFRWGQREFGGDASTSYEIPCPECAKGDKPVDHKLLNKTLKQANRELRAELKRTQIELECIKLVTKSEPEQVQETEK